jgi:hypothetical protein
MMAVMYVPPSLGLFILSFEYHVLIATRIPVYILNALYLAPLTLWTYLNYGRPSKPSKDGRSSHLRHMHHGGHHHGENGKGQGESEKKNEERSDANAPTGAQSHANSDASLHHNHEHHIPANDETKHDDAHQGHEMSGHEHHHDMSAERPMFATVTVAVCHCGAGCLLGDIVGEWLVYGTGAQIRGRMLWAEFLIGTLFDYQYLFLLSIMAYSDHVRI